MKITKLILAGVAAIAITGAATAQQSSSGTITKVDEANGKIAIQPMQNGTVGANSGGAADNEFKVQDGLMFNALKPGDKVTFTTTDAGGVKTITRLEKQ